MTSVNRENDLVQVTFLKRNGASFVRPDPEDIDTVSESDIVMVLPTPTTIGGTARACLKLLFSSVANLFNFVCLIRYFLLFCLPLAM